MVPRTGTVLMTTTLNISRFLKFSALSSGRSTDFLPPCVYVDASLFGTVKFPKEGVFMFFVENAGNQVLM